MAWTKGQAGVVISDRASKTGGEWYMRFGKHAGKKLKEIPYDYLRWAAKEIHDQRFQENLQQYREEWVAARHMAQ